MWGAAGRFTGLRYPAGLRLRYGDDATGRLSSVSHNIAGTWLPVVGSFVYLPATEAGHRLKVAQRPKRAARFARPMPPQNASLPSHGPHHAPSR